MFKYSCVLLVTCQVWGGSFTAQADCYIKNGSAILAENHGSLSCSTSDPTSVGSNLSVYINNTVYATDTSSGSMSFQLVVDKSMFGPDAPNPRGDFFSLIQYQSTLFTSGSPRQGMIEYYLEPGPFCGACSNAFDFQEWAVGSYGGRSNGRSSLYEGGGSFLLPFSLGVPFNVAMSSRSWDSDGWDGGVHGRSMLQFRILEADGITEVAMFDTPEPATALTVCGSLLCMLLVLNKRRR